MYAKVINSKTNGKIVYDNNGSSLRCANYLVKKGKEAGAEITFFGAPGSEPKTAAEVVAMIDKNVKGLGKDEVKFHSLVLSPSSDELVLIGNDAKALDKYTQNVMEEYAKNFRLKNDKELGEGNLIWAATIHQERKNRGTDDGPQGEKKTGCKRTFTSSFRPGTPTRKSRSTPWEKPTDSAGCSSRPRPSPRWNFSLGASFHAT